MLAFVAPLLFAVATYDPQTPTLIPLNDLGSAPWHYGYYGGLYDDGVNTPPADHLAGGMRRSALIQPLDANGKPSPDGKIVFLGVGFDETSRMMSAMSAMATADPRVNHETLVIANGTLPGFDAFAWMPPASGPNYSRIRDQVLAPAHVTPLQVQAAWIEMVDNAPTQPMPPQASDAYRLKQNIASVLRQLKIEYPNLMVAYLSSRVFAGYATTNWNPEPFAFESAYSVRWVIMGQVTLMRTGFLWDTRISDVDYDKGSAPWVAWGPYLWANGTTPRSDGLTWERDDFQQDGETLSEEGATKGGTLLLNFLLDEPTAWWFRSGTMLKRHTARH